jgi:hypothetical protein
LADVLGIFHCDGVVLPGAGQQDFSVVVSRLALLFIPAFLPLLLMIFWLVRVRFTNACKGMFVPRGGEVLPSATVGPG